MRFCCCESELGCDPLHSEKHFVKCNLVSDLDPGTEKKGKGLGGIPGEICIKCIVKVIVSCWW